MVKVGVVGATGYTGVELVRILSGHPEVELVHVASRSHTGTPLGAVHPHLGLKGLPGTLSLETVEVEVVSRGAEVVFLALPHGVAPGLVPGLLAAGVTVIDLGADFRLKDASLYEAWYGGAHPQRELMARAVYGLPELHREEIRGADLVANPGCYPTAAILALYPLLRENLLDHTTIVVDAKSGVSGAGRSISLGLHYSEVNDNLKAYSPAGTHRHTPEIEQELGRIAGGPLIISFTPHLVPMTRGILATVYGQLQGKHTAADLIALYHDTYQQEPFVEVLAEGSLPQTKHVFGSNHCQLGVHVDERTGRAVVVSVIDNLVKGAAGQAVQNMNLVLGLDERTGLGFRGIFP